MPAVSAFKGQFVASIFSFLLAAGRTCLLPFLTIYFYYLGLSPIQTGLLLGLKSFTSVWTALCWTKYVRSSKRKRCVLVFSIIVLMLTHMAMILVPAMDSYRASSFCSDLVNQTGQVQCSNNSSSDQLNCSLGRLSDPVNSMPLVTSGSDMTDSGVDATPSLTTSTINVEMLSSFPRQVDGDTTSKKNKFETSFDTSAADTVTAISEDSDNNTDEDLVIIASANDSSYFSEESDAGYDKNGENVFEDRARREIMRSRKNDDSSRGNKDEDVKAGFSEGDENTVDKLLTSLKSIQSQVFAALVVLVLVGEMFSSPTDQLTEDLWLRFLDRFEKLDKIHIPKLWASFGAALTPWAVVLLIDYLPCVLPLLQLPRILVHFILFELVIALALLLSFCFPVTDADGSKTKKWSRFTQGLRVVCGDVHSFVCMFTVIVVGFVYGFINTFLFWVMHEKTENGSELALGISLSVASAGEFCMSFVTGWVVKKLKCPITIILGLVVLCVRCLLYSFLFNPWIAVVGEAAHMLSHTIIWAAVRNYSAFRLNPLVMDTSAQSALSLVYSGFGISSGCIIAGLCYSYLGSKMMFQIAACVAGVWCIAFAIIYKCCSQWKKQRGRYTKIAQEEMADSNDSDDDWLSSAIKRKN